MTPPAHARRQAHVQTSHVQLRPNPEATRTTQMQPPLPPDESVIAHDLAVIDKALAALRFCRQPAPPLSSSPSAPLSATGASSAFDAEVHE